jgi:1-acyl-sn-glycerol-3-phosphate acyltransferase
MRGAWRHPFRCAGRGLWLAGEFLWATVTWWARRVRGPLSAGDRAAWLQRHSQRLLRVLHVRLRADGPVPAPGFLVANHLSYLDILVLAALAPCVFVAKREVRGWPLFGWFARMAGTVFVDRERRTDAGRAVAAMRALAGQGVTVVLFPEGTSSDGRVVLPFKSALLEPLTGEPACAVAHLRYALTDGDPADEVCYWRDMTLFPHLVNLLAKEVVAAELRSGQAPTRGLERKELAGALRERVAALGDGEQRLKTFPARPNRPLARAAPAPGDRPSPHIVPGG